MTVRRMDPELTQRYGKDPEEEALLRRINTGLEPVERALYTVEEPPHPVAFVVGVPRTGTTLLTQVLAGTLDVGYVDHIAAAFWRAPVVGIRLSAKLLAGARASSYTSEYGRTHGLAEPHEFGYFWSERLNYREPVEKSDEEAGTIDWGDLRCVLANMSAAFGRPAVLKSFHVGWHMARVAELLPRSLFVWIRRPPLETALSLLKMRREFVGSEEQWASFRPRGYEAVGNARPTEQVAFQVRELERSLARQAAAVPDGRRVVVAYRGLCRDPGSVLDRVRDSLGNLGEAPDRVGAAPSAFEPSRPVENAAGETIRDLGILLEQWYADPATVGPWTELLEEVT